MYADLSLYLSWAITSDSAINISSSVTIIVKAKIYRVVYNQSSSIAFDETSSYWSAPKI